MKNKPIELASGAWLAGEAEVYFFILVFEHARSWRKKKKTPRRLTPCFAQDLESIQDRPTRTGFPGCRL